MTFSSARLELAVVGAGIAGLACAGALQQAGHRVQLFEKSRGPGGRMSTRRDEAAGWQCDHGAQYLTARDPDFRAELQRWLAADAAALWTPRLSVIGEADRHRREAGLERFVGLPRMTAPARLLAAELALSTGCTITALQREPGGWRLHSAEKGLLAPRFDAVLLALPAPQAGALLRTAAEEELAALAQLTDSVRMRGCWALMLRYPAALALPFDAAFVNSGPLRWVARDSSKPGRRIGSEGGSETWLLHAEAEWSEARLAWPADAVAAELLRAFAALGAPAPVTWTAHRWRYADTQAALSLGSVWRAETGLGLCGDWLNGGKVEGAWLSGRALARQLAG
ncbi:NAD(P)-binding protein [Paucibacter sp. PLA-PC-4]|uniref:NAD(P)/FAD-dependent oxidoreductase n=1 Tax=Paucibacter sp. PLA-PC-4 TaxID=2993655 RepID=UPI002248B28E|nr:FAD-dependent oxidoreductase [Paucibacter sp. PLA-PC-4]MCX2860550.1 NAD(P)-binding protein [Paucibacter sp. PLA-PC-4]